MRDSSDEPGRVDAQMTRASGVRPALARIALDSLDVGVVMVKCDSRRILMLNEAARECLDAFGKVDGLLPISLWALVSGVAEDASAVPGRFTTAVPATSPDGRRFFVRGRLAKDEDDVVVVTIAAATLREVDLKRTLSSQFGLSAQEIRVAFLATQGYRNREIAKRLTIAEGTVKNYLTGIFNALSVRSRTELTAELAQLLEEQTDVHRRGT